MLLSIQQKHILEILRKLKCVRRSQLHTLMRGRFQRADFEVSDARMDAMLRQLRTCVGELRTDDEMVWLHGAVPDCRRLEAVDVMLELSEGKPMGFGVMEPPALLWFCLGADHVRLFSVADWTRARDVQMGHLARMRTVWLSESGVLPQGMTLPPKHFFAVRQDDGSHRFYGSNGP